MLKKQGIILFTFLISVLSVGMISAIALTVNEPVADEIYGSRRVTVDLTSDVSGTFYYKEDLFGTKGWTRLCRKKDTCIKTVRFNEGENRASFKVIDAVGNTDFVYEIPFKVDSKKPRVLTMLPRTNKFTNGSLFSVKYTEDNLQNITMFYGTNLDTRSVLKTSCESGSFMQCLFENIDISDFDGEKIQYWFILSDEVRSVESRKRKVKVDTTLPELVSFDWELQRNNRVSFVFEVKEDNFKEITYIDKSELEPKWKRLCSSIRDGSCNKKVRFSSGSHILDIKMSDKAGNSIFITTDEVIIV